MSRPSLRASGVLLMLSSIMLLGGCQRESKETISVSEASYGKNRRADQAGNATQYLKAACDGKTTCSYPVSEAASKIGDHSPGLTKDFDYVYLCGNKQKTGRVEGEAVGKTAFLTCAE